MNIVIIISITIKIVITIKYCFVFTLSSSCNFTRKTKVTKGSFFLIRKMKYYFLPIYYLVQELQMLQRQEIPPIFVFIEKKFTFYWYTFYLLPIYIKDNFELKKNTPQVTKKKK